LGSAGLLMNLTGHLLEEVLDLEVVVDILQ
jgi:hypothetical protein